MENNPNIFELKKKFRQIVFTSFINCNKLELIVFHFILLLKFCLCQNKLRFLGLNAVFLLGGKTKATKPTPMLLKSGDVLIMTGESRRFYHAVPKIVEKSFENSVNSTKVGENSTEVAANSVKVGENSTKLATNSVKVVENLTKVGKNSTNLGENSTKLDANLVKRVLNSTKVDETPTKLAKYSGKIAEKVGNPSEVEEKDSDFVSWYLERHRINVNIRQVH